MNIGLILHRFNNNFMVLNNLICKLGLHVQVRLATILTSTKQTKQKKGTLSWHI